MSKRANPGDGANPVSKKKQKASQEEATVLLIGSNGNGKSALGNFLLDPCDEESLFNPDKQYFSTSSDLQPHTKETKVVRKTVTCSRDSKILTVVDTPGLNDVKDRKNMVYLMKTLQDLEGINTCIVVVKFDGRIDIQYKETLKYYFKLLPDLFKRNLIVVVTCYHQDDVSIARRMRARVTEEVNKRQILSAVRTTCGLTADPTLFLIDSRPEQGDNISKKIRDSILCCVYDQEPTVPQFKVAKLSSQMQQDRLKHDKLMQEATRQSHQTYSNNPSLQEELDAIDDAIANLKVDKMHFKTRKDELDTEELIDQDSRSFHRRANFNKKRSDWYKLTSPYKIRRVIKNGQHVDWTHEQKDDHKISGKVASHRGASLNANITIQVYKKDKYENDIIDYKRRSEDTESRLQQKSEERARLREAHESLFSKKRDQQIEEARQRYGRYLSEYMTLEEAIERLSAEETTPSINSLSQLDVIKAASSKWRQLGLRLGLSSSNLDNFRTKAMLDNLICCEWVFDSWINNGGHPPKYPLSWKGVYDVLCAIELCRIANDMKEKIGQ